MQKKTGLDFLGGESLLKTKREIWTHTPMSIPVCHLLWQEIGHCKILTDAEVDAICKCISEGLQLIKGQRGR